MFVLNAHFCRELKFVAILRFKLRFLLRNTGVDSDFTQNFWGKIWRLGALLWSHLVRQGNILIDGKIFSEYRQWLWWWGWCDDRNDEEDGDNRDILSTSEWTLWSHLVIQGKCRAGFRSTSCVFLSINGWFSKVISFLLVLERLIYRGGRYIPDNLRQPVPMCWVLNPAISSFTLHKYIIKPNCKISFITRTKITDDLNSEFEIG